MKDKMLVTLEFDKILDILKEHTISEEAGDKAGRLLPYLSEAEVSRHMNETTEAKLIMEQYGNPPLSPMTDLNKSLSSLGKGILLMPEQLGNIALFLTACRRLKSYLKKAENTSAAVAFYGNSIYDLSCVEDEINRAVRGGCLDDKASPVLADIRRKIAFKGEQVRTKLDSLLRNNKAWFSESFVSLRNGRYTLPVKKEYKNLVAGTVIDVSQSGGTYFIEPSAAGKLQEEISILHMEEENEIRRILYELTALVEENLAFVNINIQAMESIDFIFAKAKLSIAMDAIPLPVLSERRIEIKGGRHPLLKTDNIIPLDFSIGGSIRGVVITGPNTGGKTVALKTIGLLSLMAQCGLHVPAEEGCFSMNNYVLCDIGDGQSITENLSTFSSHITNIIGILRKADDQSLVLLDELGSGTDPAEGMGLAISILEELSGRNCLFVATTHYPEIKEFARTAPGLINARMAFDAKTLLPLYRLEIGEAGESCALLIAKRLGLPPHMIQRAAAAAYKVGQGNTATSGKEDGSVVSVISGAVYASDPADIPAQKDNPDIAAFKRIKRQTAAKPPESPRSMRFNMGDAVMVYPQRQLGIVCRKANEKGEITVQIRKKKMLVNHKRLKLHIPADKLYPDDYDFSIVFDTVDNRKARHKMEKRHDPELLVQITDEKGGV